MSESMQKRRARELMHLVGPDTSYQPCQQTLNVLHKLRGRIDLGDLEAFFGPSFEPHKIALRMDEERADLSVMLASVQVDETIGAWVAPGLPGDDDSRLFVPFQLEDHAVLVEFALTDMSARKRCWRIEDGQLDEAFRRAESSGDNVAFPVAADFGHLSDLLPPMEAMGPTAQSRKHEALLGAVEVLLEGAELQPSYPCYADIDGVEWWCLHVNGFTIWNLPDRVADTLRDVSALEPDQEQ